MTINFPPRNETNDFAAALNQNYKDAGSGIQGNIHVDLEGWGVWVQEYLRLRVNGYSHVDAQADVFAQIADVRDPSHAPHPRPAPPAQVPQTPPPGQHPPPADANLAAVARIRAALAQVDQVEPALRIRNLKPDCWRALRAAAKLAGPDFAFIGKTATMDGGGKYTPPGFTAFDAELFRPDGQKQTVTIVGLSMDALWFLPTMRQIKAIVNSTDGEISEGGSGKPASYDSYLIDEFDKDGHRQYRWHNPPVAQF